MLEIFIGLLALTVFGVISTFIGYLFRPAECWFGKFITGVIIIIAVICGLAALQGIGSEILTNFINK